MADFRAIEGISEALVQVLRLNYDSAYFDGHGLQIQAYTSRNHSEPMSAGISVFLYRVTIDGNHRNPSGRLLPDGRRYPPLLPLDLHYLVTAWAQDATLQHRILGWAMRTLEDTPILPYGLLENAAPGVFQPDETVEVIPDKLVNEDLFRIWETLGTDVTYRLSVPYLARSVRVESQEPEGVTGAYVQERLFNHGRVGSEPAPSSSG